MATILIQNGAYCGAAQAIFEERGSPSGDENTLDILELIAAAVVTANAALNTPMADGDNAQIGQLLQSVTYACMKGRSFVLSEEADAYEGIATQIVAVASELAAGLTA